MSGLTRAILILGSLLAVQVIVILLLPKEGEATTAKTDDAAVAGREPFSGIDAKAVRGVTVTGGDGKVVDLAATVKKDGDKDITSWALANRDQFAARTADVERILDAAKRIRFSRVISRQPKRYARLNVADGVTHARVVITGEGGKRLADFRVGESKDMNSVHVRVEGDPAVYEASGVSTWDFPTSLSGLVDSGFVDLPADQVVRVKLTGATPADTLDVMKEVPASRPTSAPTESAPTSAPTETKPEPRWITGTLDHLPLDKTKVESWIRGLCRINLGEPIGKARRPEYGFEKPTAAAVITFADGKEVTITIGAERKEEKDYYLTATDKDFVVTVASWNVTDQFQKKLKDLQPPAPGEAPAPAPHDHDHDHR
jgi:hypothetical protein